MVVSRPHNTPLLCCSPPPPAFKALQILSFLLRPCMSEDCIVCPAAFLSALHLVFLPCDQGEGRCDCLNARWGVHSLSPFGSVFPLQFRVSGLQWHGHLHGLSGKQKTQVSLWKMNWHGEMPLLNFHTKWTHSYFETCAEDFLHGTKRRYHFC